MTPSISSIHEKFRQLNKQMFGGVLETIPVDITTAKNYLGVIKFKKDLMSRANLSTATYSAFQRDMICRKMIGMASHS